MNDKLKQKYGFTGNKVPLANVIGSARANFKKILNAKAAQGGMHALKIKCEIDQNDADYATQMSAERATPDQFVDSLSDAELVYVVMMLAKDFNLENFDAFIDDLQEIDESNSLYDALWSFTPGSYTEYYGLTEFHIEFVNDNYKTDKFDQDLVLAEVFGEIHPLDIEFPAD